MIGADTTFLVQLELKETPGHAAAHALLKREILDPGIPLGLSPQVLAEFIHVVTDPRRFQHPLTMDAAVAKARFWWQAVEVKPLLPTVESTALALHWLHQHRLGRKRILDTQLAALFWSRGVRSLISSNAADFQLFGFTVMAP